MRKVFSLFSLALAGVCLVSVSSFAEKPVAQGSHGGLGSSAGSFIGSSAVANKITELKVSRPTANPVLEGTVVIKAVDLREDSPFLRVKTTNGSIKDYLIRTCDETCQKAINACKGGEQCSVRGKVDETAPSIMAEFVRVGATTAVSADETKATKTNHVFTRDTSNPKLGEAWRDPSGMIWGDIVKKEDDSPRFMNHKDATDYCKGIGAELPSYEDLVRLREYVGAKSGSNEGITPQVLPNLTYAESGKTHSHYFWSSTVHSDLPHLSYTLVGSDARIGSFPRTSVSLISVRCVSTRR